MAMDMLSTVVKPVHREGHKFIAIFGLVTLVLFYFSNFLGWIGVGLTVWCYYFFRDPERVTPVRDGLIVSPADGVVSLISREVPPTEMEMGEAARIRVSIFMNVFNCHVNRIPIGGTVVKTAYRPGAFINASLDKASEENERNGVVIEMQDGRPVGVVQIAGLVARRILCEVKEGERVQTGERFGMIRFGSRLDVYLPEGVVPFVVIGQTMVAGETVLADLGSAEPERQGEIR